MLSQETHQGFLGFFALQSLGKADALGIQVAGIDLLFTEHGYTICEANTFPGFKGLEKACEVNVPYEIFTAMQEELEARGGPRRARLA